MLKDHPKGLFVLAFANMGERFGYYTMLAIFTLYLQARYGWTSAATGQMFGIFLAAVYFLPVLGGFVADKYLVTEKPSLSELSSCFSAMPCSPSAADWPS